jgi:hypothetical protein
MKNRGISHIHHLFLARQAQTIGLIWSKIESVKVYRTRQMLKFWFDQSIPGLSLLNRYGPSHFSQVNRQMSGVYGCDL